MKTLKTTSNMLKVNKKDIRITSMKCFQASGKYLR